MEKQTTGRPKVDWTPLRDFTDEETGITVRLQKLPLGRPLFSFCVDGRKKDGGGTRWMHVKLTSENGQVNLKSVADALSRLVAQMETVAFNERQTAEDNCFARQEKREAKKYGSEKDTAKGAQGLSKFTDGSKTEREAGKNARHLQNLDRRRSEDQTRASRR
jgi:hypothetical protein